jgi:HEAT repeat protein
MLADEPLVATLTIADATVRVEVARALGDLADARAIEPLAAALTDLDDEVQWRPRKRWRVFAMGVP